MLRSIAITGASGYLGRALSTALITRGLAVRAIVRHGSAARAVAGTEVREVDVFDATQLSAALRTGDTLVHLIGTPNPNPRKAAEFERVDLASVRIATVAAVNAGVAHFLYVSVAQPAPVMQAYIETRRAAEAAIVAAGLTATFIRPWYVLGPGHRWPYLLLPFYSLASLLPATRDTARRLGLVTLAQMTRALVAAVERPPGPESTRIVDVPEIRAS